MPLERLIYRSLNAMNVTGARSLIHFHDIVSTARRNNPKLGICGFLMFDKVRFYQILEGETTSLDALFKTITSDNRHREIVCLSREAITALTFTDWSMATFLSDQVPHPLMLSLGITSLSVLSAIDFLRFAHAFVQQDEPD